MLDRRQIAILVAGVDREVLHVVLVLTTVGVTPGLDRALRIEGILPNAEGNMIRDRDPGQDHDLCHTGVLALPVLTLVLVRARDQAPEAAEIIGCGLSYLLVKKRRNLSRLWLRRFSSMENDSNAPCENGKSPILSLAS